MTRVAPDGSPVEFYRRIPPQGEAELVHAVVPPGGSILDLGCGPGRIAGPLAALGHPVTGVDNGEAMIAALPADVEGVIGDARTIRLGRTFDAVLLASHLVNDPEGGPQFVATAAAHLAPGACAVGQTYAPGWDPTRGIGTVTRLGDATVELVAARVEGDLLHAAVRYGVDGTTWEQPFTARLMDEEALVALLEQAGLAFERWLSLPGWFIARRAAGAPAG